MKAHSQAVLPNSFIESTPKLFKVYKKKQKVNKLIMADKITPFQTVLDATKIGKGQNIDLRAKNLKSSKKMKAKLDRIMTSDVINDLDTLDMDTE